MYKSVAASSDYQPAPPQPLKPPIEWSTGLCDCFSNWSNCCITFWCPCVTFGRIAEIVDRGSTSCGASGALYALITSLTGFGWLYSCFYSSKMRAQYNLKGNDCLDCLTHFFCEPCALCQEYRQLEKQGFNMVLGWHGNVEQQTQGVAMTSTAPTVEQGMNR
ncbi:protein PLANT CADMIUM RESISTANCE 2-like [Lotus japonicus]|uniref:protein PLANT CADMIUM RESISTANCE 2-like n=1 Tax=Lotus japonicus TaxID=34305 RepID=UPI00258F65B1|nr:protein PLANT CADMIUM RESISTANCE 2-like [Lotus japonicus]